MPPPYPPLPPLPQPTREVFDPFNSTSTGHQHADSSISSSTSWRASRTHKLSHQLRDITGSGGARHISDLVGASSENFSRDGRKGNGDWGKSTPGLRGDACRDIRDMMQGTRKRGSEGTAESSTSKKKAMVERKDGGGQGTSEGLQDWQGKLSTDETLISTAKSDPQLRKALGWSTVVATEKSDGGGPSTTPPPRIPDPTPPPQIFSGLNIYLNGSTLPHISDHKLKHLLAQHGANISIALGRRTVTHVILSDKGRLAAGKIQKEVTKIGGKGVKFVGVRWVLDSIEKGRRQPESRYEVVRLAMKGQRSVLGMGIRNLDRGEERNDE